MKILFSVERIDDNAPVCSASFFDCANVILERYTRYTQDTLLYFLSCFIQ